MLGWRLNVLWSAGVHTADYVVVAVRDDAMAMRITSIARSLNETARLICVINDPELYDLVGCLGADNVLGPVEAAEWAFGSPGVPAEGSGLPELEWAVAERPVAHQEVGCSPLECGNQVLAVVREEGASGRRTRRSRRCATTTGCSCSAAARTRVDRWNQARVTGVRMVPHVVLIGYGDTGRVVLRALRFDPRRSRPTVVDANPARAVQARVDGADAVEGPGWRLETLSMAGVQEATHAVVAVSDDALALRITSVVRSLNEEITLTTVVRSPDLVELLRYLGADHVLTEDEVEERFTELRPEPVEPPPDDNGLAVLQRAVRLDEIGLLPFECGPEVLAVIRDGRRVWTEDPSAERLRQGDLLVVLDRVPPAG